MKTLADIDDAKDKFLSIRKPDWIYASAALSLDGKITSHYPLGGAVDREWYRFLVDQAETVVVGAETFRKPTAAARYQGKEIVVLSRSLEFPSECFQGERCVLYTTNHKRPNLGRNVRIKPFVSAADISRDLGMRKVLVDGGGAAYTLWGNVIEDWFLTLVPRFSGPSQTAIWTGAEGPGLRPAWIWEADDRIFGRFQRKI